MRPHTAATRSVRPAASRLTAANANAAPPMRVQTTARPSQAAVSAPASRASTSSPRR